MNSNNINSKSDQLRDVSNDPKPQMNLLEFSRIYEIHNIPFINFFIVYALLYSLNCLHFGYDFRLVLLASIPITIFLSMISNPGLNLSLSMMIVLVVSVVLVMVSLPVN
jgi:hypothetical protein